MGVLTDLAGVGALGKRAQDFAGGAGRTKKRSGENGDDDDRGAFSAVPGSSDTSDEGLNTMGNKRPNGKRSQKMRY